MSYLYNIIIFVARLTRDTFNAQENGQEELARR